MKKMPLETPDFPSAREQMAALINRVDEAFVNKVLYQLTGFFATMQSVADLNELSQDFIYEVAMEVSGGAEALDYFKSASSEQIAEALKLLEYIQQRFEESTLKEGVIYTDFIQVNLTKFIANLQSL